MNKMRNFKKLLMRAKMGDQKALLEIIEMYSRLVSKESVVDGVFDDDLRQVLMSTLLLCIRGFKF
jgi:hypothetical protein